MNLLVVSQHFWPENLRINDLALGLLERGHEVAFSPGSRIIRREGFSRLTAASGRPGRSTTGFASSACRHCLIPRNSMTAVMTRRARQR
jgi:hypothetical protein